MRGEESTLGLALRALETVLCNGDARHFAGGRQLFRNGLRPAPVMLGLLNMCLVLLLLLRGDLGAGILNMHSGLSRNLTGGELRVGMRE